MNPPLLATISRMENKGSERPKDAVGLPKNEFRHWVKVAKTSSLEESFHHMSYQSRRQHWEIVEVELRRRRSRPHWSVWLGLVVAALGTIFAAIAAWPTLQEWMGR